MPLPDPCKAMEGHNQKMVEMLETMRREQEELTRVLVTKEEEVAVWEARVVGCRGSRAVAEASLHSLRRGEMLVEEETELARKKVKSSTNTVKEKAEELELHLRNIEKLKMAREVMEARKVAVEEKISRRREMVRRGEEETELGRELVAVRRTLVEVGAEVAVMREEHGELEEVAKKRKEMEVVVAGQVEEWWQVEEECGLQQQLVQERRGLVARMEVEARMRDNRVEAQVRRLRRRRDELREGRAVPGGAE